MTKTPSLSDLMAENTQQRNRIAQLEEQLAWLTRQLFGQRSEKFVDGLDENQPLIPGFEPPKEPEEKKKPSLPMIVVNPSAMAKIKSPFPQTYL